jgi:3-phenylpropionate/trans-cinnamate dioxygenase ferredoxin reductase component
VQEVHASEGPVELHPLPAGFPHRGQPTHDPGAAPTGAGPNTPEPRVEGEALKLLDPRVPLGAPPLMTLHANEIGREKKSLLQEVPTGGIRS